MPEAAGDHAAEFAKALETQADRHHRVRSEIFGPAANNGQMIAEIAAKPYDRASRFRRSRSALTGRARDQEARRGRCCRPLLEKLRVKQVIACVEYALFGKRSDQRYSAVRQAPPLQAPEAVAPSAAAGPARSARRSPPPVGAPPISAGATRRARRSRRASRAALGRILRRQDDGLQRADRHDRPDAARQARRRVGARGDPRHRQRDHPDQERRHVDRRAGGAARGHLQRRARLRPARAAAGARRHRRHHGQRRRHGATSRSPARCRRPACASPTTRS